MSQKQQQQQQQRWRENEIPFWKCVTGMERENAATGTSEQPLLTHTVFNSIAQVRWHFCMTVACHVIMSFQMLNNCVWRNSVEKPKKRKEKHFDSKRKRSKNNLCQNQEISPYTHYTHHRGVDDGSSLPSHG